MIGRGYMVKVLNRLAEIHQEMNELLDKQVNAQKERIFWGSCELPQAHKKGVQ